MVRHATRRKSTAKGALDGKLPRPAHFHVEGLERRLFLSTAIVAFGAQQTFAAGAGPYSVATADVNGDGKADVVVTNEYDGNVSVLLGNGNGRFAAAQNFAAGSYPSSVAISDVNGDGKPDLIVVSSGEGNVYVLAGNGTGAFGAPQLVLSGTGPIFVAAADVNVDGRADLVVVKNTGSSGSSVSVLLGNGNGTYLNQRTFAIGSSPFSVAVSDVNGDGKPDLLVANSGDGNVGMLIGNGNGSFQPQVPIAVGAGPVSVAVSDMNGDGKRDLVVANYGGGTVSVVLGNGNGTFHPQQTFGAGGNPRSAVVADFNGDGKPDVLVANYYNNTVSVLVGSGDGTLQPAITYATGSHPWSVSATDVNRDGKPDLVVANRGSNNVSVLLGDVAPTVVSINRGNPPGPVTFQSSVSFTVTFSEPVTGVDYSDFVLANTGSVSATNFFIVNGSNADYVVTVYNISGSGTLGLNFVDDGSVTDAAGNPFQPVNSFQAPQYFATGIYPSSVAVSDVNGDGRPDLVTANYGSKNTSVLLGNGNGTFQPQKTFVSGYGSIFVAVSDVNGDGKPDLLVANYGTYEGVSYGGSNTIPNGTTVSVLLGNGNGTFQAQPLVTTGTCPRSVAVSDVNGDGRPDLVVANLRSNTVSVLLGNGNGTFRAQQTLATGAKPFSVTVADLNGDGRPDLAVANQYGFNVSVLLGNGNGTFQAQQTFAADSFPASVVVSDVNGDGRPDLVVANRGSVHSVSIGDVSVLLGNGNGTFQAQQTFAAGAGPISVAVSDLNGDGRPDLVVANEFNTPGTMSVLLGNGNGTFQTQQVIASGDLPAFAAASDLNGDGKPDVLTVNRGDYYHPDNTVGVLMGVSNGRVTTVGQAYTIVLPPDTITGTTGNDSITLTQDADGTDIDWAIGTTSGKLPINNPNGLTINGFGGSDTINLSYVRGNPLPNILHVSGSFTVNGLQGTNALAGTKLEIGQSTVYFNYASAPNPTVQIQTALKNGYNGGAWNGSATASTGVITSGAAASGPLSTFGVGFSDWLSGIVIGQPSLTVEIRYTRMGDANLDRVVDVTDALLMARHYLASGAPTWDVGNFNYDTIINLSDATLLQKNWGGTATGSVTPAITSPTPVAVSTTVSTADTSNPRQNLPTVNDDTGQPHKKHTSKRPRVHWR
jgi:hypothetical protein